MRRIAAIDFGTVRCGIALSDPLQIIANPVETIPTARLEDYIKRFISKFEIGCLVVGEPLNLKNKPQAIEENIQKFIFWFQKFYPQILVVRQDERFTSSIAADAMIHGGLKKSKRRDKSRLDVMSAVLILQAYLDKQIK